MLNHIETLHKKKALQKVGKVKIMHKDPKFNNK
jgi:hypothetical protein